MGDLRFEFSLDAAEQVQAASLARRRTAANRIWRRVGLPLLALPVVLVLVLGQPLESLSVYLVILALLGVFSLALPAIQRWQVRRALASVPGLSGPLVYRLTESGIELSTAISSTQLSWEGVHEAQETKDMFLLYFAGGVAYYLPKRIVGSKAEALRMMLRARLGSRAGTIDANTSQPAGAATIDVAR